MLIVTITLLIVSLLTNPVDYSSTFYVDATWYPNERNVKITYNDVTNATQNVTLEVLGLARTYHVEHTSSEFIETINFDKIPQNGWRAHPVIFDVTHLELGKINLKVEIHANGDPPTRVIYGNSN